MNKMRDPAGSGGIGDIYGPSRVARIKFDQHKREVAYIYPAFS